MKNSSRRRKEMMWQSRREDERRRKNQEWGKWVVEQVIEKAWKELKNKEVKYENVRVEKAQLKSVTARLNHCTSSDRKRKKDWQQTKSPCKSTILAGRGKKMLI